ncbi:hypothetical protein QW060_23235 [Myroides ceti]|uniref:Uncharacterized protein n=1 Tax=Paenimyroides ceti TaxID=395087 RepID=A0ABT8D1Q9_9FLAO|nr:hypothetical protein [Paenimyroides ceti]MDN3709851.1 hypothetical protein [Paenimyroides ceti]
MWLPFSIFYEKSAKDTFILNSELFFGYEDEIYVTKAIGSAEILKVSS